MCATEVRSDGMAVATGMEVCSSDCPIHPDGFTNDETLKITHHHSYDWKEIWIALRLYFIMSSSLLLIGLMVTGLGIYIGMKYKE